MASIMAAINEKRSPPPPSCSAFALYKLADLFDNLIWLCIFFRYVSSLKIVVINMSKPKKSKSEAECGEGSSCSTNTGGGIIETCIIHFPDVNASNTIVSLSNIENPSERLENLNDICRRRLLEPQGSVQRMTDICSQVLSTYSKEQLYEYHRQCYQRFTGNLHRLQASAFLEAEPSTSRPKRRSSTEKYIFPPECIFFCGREQE